MRLSFLSADRPDVGFTAKEAARAMRRMDRREDEEEGYEEDES